MPKFSKRHYKEVAGVLRHCVPGEKPGDLQAKEQWKWMVVCFADILAKDNPKFNRALFLLACSSLSEDKYHKRNLRG